MQTSGGQIDIMDVTVEEYYRLLDERLRGIRGMNLARWQLIKQTMISLIIAVFAYVTGAEPTFTVGAIALINGVSIADLATIWGQTPSPDEGSQTDRPAQLPDGSESESDREKEKNRR